MLKMTMGKFLDKVLKDSGKTEIGGLNSKRTGTGLGQCPEDFKRRSGKPFQGNKDLHRSRKSLAKRTT